MEWIAAIFTGLLGVAGAPGVIIDRTATDALRRQIHRAEILEVRVDNTPNYQILQGKVDRIRVAARGVYIAPFLRVEAIDLETDPIAIDPVSLQTGQLMLLQPAQAAVRVSLKSEDINQALRSPAIAGSFRSVRVNLSTVNPGAGEQIFDFINPEVKFLEDNRIHLAATLQPRPAGNAATTARPIDVSVEAKLNVVGGTRLEILDPKINLQGVSLPEQISNAFVSGLNRVLDLRQLEASGIVARVLRFELRDGQLQVVGFARMESTTSLLRRSGAAQFLWHSSKTSQGHLG